MAQTKEITVPDIGDFDEVDVIEVLVQPGDSVEAEESLITLESDKATMEVPCPEAGTRRRRYWSSIGDKVSEGTAIVRSGGHGTAVAPPEDVGMPRRPAAAAANRQAAAVRGGAGGDSETVTVPDIGDFDEVDVIEVLVQPGDSVEAEESLITLESDKATMEVPVTEGPAPSRRCWSPSRGQGFRGHRSSRLAAAAQGIGRRRGRPSPAQPQASRWQQAPGRAAARR
ncbi:MAG: biotin/lipoyl-containing protein [Arhodomonas sp.]|nr:biotin/lipoyl-containing protein [Arhodomonas sp.]